MKQMVIEHPAYEERTEIERLWRLTFHDDDAFLRPYFSHLYDEKHCYVLRTKEERITSFVHVIPLHLHTPKKTFHVGYFFGLMTRESLRQRGYGTSLIRQVLTEEQKQGRDFALLVPSTDSLRPYYERFGFRPALFVTERACRSLTCGTSYETYLEEEKRNNENYLTVTENHYLTVVENLQQEGTAFLTLHDSSSTRQYRGEKVSHGMALCLCAEERDFALIECAAGNLLMDT